MIGARGFKIMTEKPTDIADLSLCDIIDSARKTREPAWD